MSDYVNRLTGISSLDYINEGITSNSDLISSNSNGINGNAGAIGVLQTNQTTLLSNQTLISEQVDSNVVNIGVLQTNQNLISNQVDSNVADIVVLYANDTSLQGQIDDINDAISDNGNLNPLDIFGNIQDFLGLLGDVLIGATLASYFSKDGLVGTKLLDDLAENALDALEWEDDEDEENNKQLWDIYKIYKRPFSVVNRDVFGRSPIRYTTSISNIDQYSMGYLGNQYYSPNTILGCSSNIQYSVGIDNAQFTSLAVTEHHKDTVVYRDSLQGLSSEMFIDYMFVGISNQDSLTTLNPQNDYSFRMRVEGDMNVSGDLYVNSDIVIDYDPVADTRTMRNIQFNNVLIEDSNNPYIQFKSLDNSVSEQDIILCQNSGSFYTFRLRRDLFLVNDVTKPNYVLSIGSSNVLGDLNDTMRFYNDGMIDFNYDIIVNADAIINGHRYSSNGVQTDQLFWGVRVDQDGNNNYCFEFNTLKNLSLQDLDLQDNDLINVKDMDCQSITLGSNLINVETYIQDINDRLQNQQNVYGDSGIDTPEIVYDINLNTDTLLKNVWQFNTTDNSSFQNINMNTNNIIGIGSNNYNLENELQNINSKIIIIDSNNQIDYSNIVNVPAVGEDNDREADMDMNTFNIVNIGSNNYDLNLQLEQLNAKTSNLDSNGEITSNVEVNDNNLTGVKSIIFRNKEVGNVSSELGSFFFDVNFWNTGETGSNFVSKSGSHIGGLSIHDGVSWAGVVSDKNMFGLNATFNSLSLDGDLNMNSNRILDCTTIQTGGVSMRGPAISITDSNIFPKFFLQETGELTLYNTINMIDSAGLITSTGDITLQTLFLQFKDTNDNQLLTQTPTQTRFHKDIEVQQKLEIDSNAFIQSDFDINFYSDTYSFMSSSSNAIIGFTNNSITLHQDTVLSNTADFKNGLITDYIKVGTSQLNIRDTDNTTIANFDKTTSSFISDLQLNGKLICDDIKAADNTINIYNALESKQIIINPNEYRIENIQEVKGNSQYIKFEDSNGNRRIQWDINKGSQTLYSKHSLNTTQTLANLHNAGNFNLIRNGISDWVRQTNDLGNDFQISQQDSNGIIIYQPGTYEVFGQIELFNSETIVFDSNASFNVYIENTGGSASGDIIKEPQLLNQTSKVYSYHTILNTSNSSSKFLFKMNTDDTELSLQQFRVFIKRI